MKNRCKNTRNAATTIKTGMKFIEKSSGRRFNNNITMGRRCHDDDDDDDDDDGLEPYFPVL